MQREHAVHHQDDDVVRRARERDDAAGAALPRVLPPALQQRVYRRPLGRLRDLHAPRHGLREQDRARDRGDIQPCALEGGLLEAGRALDPRARAPRRVHRGAAPRACVPQQRARAAAAGHVRPAGTAFAHAAERPWGRRRRRQRGRGGRDVAAATDEQHLPREREGVPTHRALRRLPRVPRDRWGSHGDDWGAARCPRAALSAPQRRAQCRVRDLPIGVPHGRPRTALVPPQDARAAAARVGRQHPGGLAAHAAGVAAQGPR